MSEPSEGGGATGRKKPSRRRIIFFNALVVAPMIGMLWVPFYNHLEPKLGSIPFFFWYQLMWVIIGAGINAVAYFATR